MALRQAEKDRRLLGEGHQKAASKLPLDISNGTPKKNQNEKFNTNVSFVSFDKSPYQLSTREKIICLLRATADWLHAHTYSKASQLQKQENQTVYVVNPITYIETKAPMRKLDALVLLSEATHIVVNNKFGYLIGTRNHNNPLRSIQKEHAKYMVGPHASSCIFEMSAIAANAAHKREAESQARANGRNLLQDFALTTRNNTCGDDGSQDKSSGVASASATNEIAHRNVRNNNDSNKTNTKKKKTVTKAKKAVKAGLKTSPKARNNNPPTTRSQTRATSTPTTITATHHNNHSGTVSDESTDLVSHAEFTMDDSIIPKLQTALVDTCFSLRYPRKQFMKTMTALSKKLHDNYDGVNESYPGKGNK